MAFRILSCLALLFIAACGQSEEPARAPERRATLSDFHGDLQALLARRSDPFAQALAEAARTEFDRLTAEPAAAGNDQSDAEGSSGSEDGLAFAPVAEGICSKAASDGEGGDTSPALAAAAGDLGTHSLTINDAMAQCAPSCPGVPCEAYGDALLAMRRGMVASAMLADRIASASLIEPGRLVRERIVWHEGIMASAGDTYQTLIDTVDELTDSRTTTIPPLPNLAQTLEDRSGEQERLSALTGDMMWDNTLRGAGAPALQGDLDQAAGALARLAVLLPRPPLSPAEDASDGGNNGDTAPQPLSPSLAAPVAQALLEAAQAATRAAERVSTLPDPSQTAQADTGEGQAGCRLSLAARLKDAVAILEARLPSLEECAAIAQCPVHGESGLDVLTLSEQPLKDTARVLTTAAGDTQTLAPDFSGAECAATPVQP